MFPKTEAKQKQPPFNMTSAQSLDFKNASNSLGGSSDDGMTGTGAGSGFGETASHGFKSKRTINNHRTGVNFSPSPSEGNMNEGFPSFAMSPSGLSSPHEIATQTL